MVATSLEASADGIDQNPFRSRFIRLRFSSPIPDLDEGRLIATLWGCIRRRVCYSPFSTTPNDLCLYYQDSEGYFIPDELDPKEPFKGDKSIHGLCPEESRNSCCWLRGLKRKGFCTQSKVGRKSAASSSYAEPTAAPGTARRATGTTGSTTTHCWGAMTIKKGLLFDLPLALTWISCICRERQLVVIGITIWIVRTGIRRLFSSHRRLQT